MTELQTGLDATLRENFYFFVWKVFDTLHPGKEQTFIPNWHVEAMCFQLERLARGETTRLMILVPPRHLKSITVSVAYTAWMLGHDPTLKIMVASYGSDLAAKHARDFRVVIESEWYQRLFPKMRINPRVNRETEIATTLGGGRKAVSVGGPTTGFGADILVIDDIMKAIEAGSATERERVLVFFETALLTRLNDKQTGRIVSIQQRLHEDDLPGHLMDLGVFDVLELKAIAETDESFQVYQGRRATRKQGEALFPQREPLATLEKLRRELGSFPFATQYQQNPAAPEGNLLRWEWFQTFDAEDYEREDFRAVVQSWDTAVTAEPDSDFSVCTTWGYRDGIWHLLDRYRARLEYPDLKRKVRALAHEWRAGQVVIEKDNVGYSLVQELRREGMHHVIYLRPILSKEERAVGQTGKIEAGRVLFPKEAPWLDSFRHEITVFPNGRHDDQVDSMVQFLEWIDTGVGRSFMNRDPVTGRPRSNRRRGSRYR
jgi:predicted phage terminase large subunit-like protein